MLVTKLIQNSIQLGNFQKPRTHIGNEFRSRRTCLTSRSRSDCDYISHLLFPYGLENVIFYSLLSKLLDEGLSRFRGLEPGLNAWAITPVLVGHVQGGPRHRSDRHSRRWSGI